MPLVNRTFDQLIDFTRTSAGTFVGSNGLIQNTAASANLLTFTQDFDNAGWVKTTTTVVANSDVAPDGTSTADTLTASGANGTTLQSFTAAAVPYTFSIWLRRLTGTGDVQITVDGTTYVTVAVTTTWTRFQTPLTPAAGARTAGVRIVTSGDAVYAWGAQLELGSVATAYDRNFGGVFPPRFDFNPVSRLPLGLLVEEQRTNLLLYSEQFDNAYWTASAVTVTANTSVSPDGATTADTFDDGVTSALHRVFRTAITYTAAAQTVSVYAKAGTGAWFQFVAFDGTNTFYANFNVSTGAVGNKAAGVTSSSIIPAGNGWYRCVMTMTTLATAAGNFQIGMLDADTASATPTFTGANRTLFMWGAQHEVGAFATSYIPTVASQVTRTADIALIQTPNFAPWYNQPQGTFFVEFTPDTTVASVNVRVLTVSQAAAAGRVVDIYPNVGIWTTFNGTANLATGAATVTSTPQKFAAAFASGSYAACFNGGTVATASTATVNSPTQMTIGHFPSPTNFINGHIRSIRFYPTRLNDAQLQALTV